MINTTCTFPRDRWIPCVVLVTAAAVAWCVGHLPTHRAYWPAHSAQRPAQKEAPPRASAQSARPLGVACAVARQAPTDLGALRPTGRINPDGSEVWGYPEGSELEEVIEVHVKDGRVVREVLRPASVSSAHLVAGVLSEQDGRDAGRDSSGP